MPDLSKWPMPRLLSTAARLVEYEWNEQLASLGLTHAGATVLEILAVEGPMAQAQLAKRVRVQPQTVGKTLARLEATGYISRARSTDDRREQRVNISRRGKETLHQVMKLGQELLGEDDGEIEELKTRLIGVVRDLGNDRFGIKRPLRPG